MLLPPPRVDRDGPLEKNGTLPFAHSFCKVDVFHQWDLGIPSIPVKRFLADDYDKRMTQRRGGQWKGIPIDAPGAEAMLSEAGPEVDSPDLLFDRSWALDLLDHAMRKLEAEYAAAGKSELCEKLKPTISPQLQSQPYSTLAPELGMTEGAVKVAVHRLRQRYRDCLHAALHDTLENPEDTEEELRYLLSVFSKP